MIIGFIAFVLSTSLGVAPAVAQIEAAGLVISQVQTGLAGTGNTTKDFVELYNPTAQSVSLGDYVLAKRTKTGSSNTVIKAWGESELIGPRSYHLWANSGYADISVSPDSATTQTISDDNAVAIILGDKDTGQIIDGVGWGENTSGLVETRAFADNIPPGQSIKRAADTNNNALDFILGPSSPRNSSFTEPSVSPEEPEPEPEPAPEEASPIISPPPAELVLEVKVILNELVPNPAGRDADNEWVEIVNVGQGLVNLDGWYLEDKSGDSWSLPAMDIEPGQHHQFILPSGFTLNNSDETVRLYDQAGQVSDSAAYEVSFENQSLSRFNDEWLWTLSLTPGAGNQFLEEKKDPPEETDEEILEAELPTGVLINEIFANPDGADSGLEWVELKNESEKDMDLTGWYLDDEGKTLGKSALRLPSGSIMGPGEKLFIQIPDGYFTIKNTNGVLRLVAPNKKEVERIYLPKIAENQSFARFADNKWTLTLKSTPGLANEQETELKQVLISEIYFAAYEGEREFIELVNHEAAWVDLTGWRLSLRDKEFVFPSGAVLPAQGYLVLSSDLTKLNLSSGNWAELALINSNYQTVDALSRFVSSGVKNVQGASLGFKDNEILVGSSSPGQPNGSRSLVRVEYRLASEERLPEIAATDAEFQAGEVLAGSIEAEINTPEVKTEVKITRGSERRIWPKIKAFFCRFRLFMLRCDQN